MTFDPGVPPAGSDDHEFAAWAATRAGELLTQVRARGLEGSELKDAGDLASHELLMSLLAQYRPDDAVLSEEEHRGTASRLDRRTARRVWIIDPLDGTREFSEPPRDDWAVHVALWQEGELVAGAVAQPGLNTTFRTAASLTVPPSDGRAPRLVVSRTRPPAFMEGLVEELGATLVPMGSAGAKAMSVIRGVSDAYVHAGGQYEWDSAAPVAVARDAGLFTSRIDGSPLRYNREDPTLPDLVICRPELATQILDYLARNPPA
ncbi:MAG: 3'(2'),5'-bisphosphate nucleotidase CysQ [Marmoricola sp.]